MFPILNRNVQEYFRLNRQAAIIILNFEEALCTDLLKPIRKPIGIRRNESLIPTTLANFYDLSLKFLIVTWMFLSKCAGRDPGHKLKTNARSIREFGAGSPESQRNFQIFTIKLQWFSNLLTNLIWKNFIANSIKNKDFSDKP